MYMSTHAYTHYLVISVILNSTKVQTLGSVHALISRAKMADS